MSTTKQDLGWFAKYQDVVKELTNMRKQVQRIEEENFKLQRAYAELVALNMQVREMLK